MTIREIILKKRKKYQSRLDSILFRILAPVKLVVILGLTVFILRTIFPGNLFENPTVISILTIIIIVGIFYSFDFLFLILYMIVRKSSKSQMPQTKKSKKETKKSNEERGRFIQEMETSKQEMEHVELTKEKELWNELEKLPKLIEEKQYVIVKDKLDCIIHESKKFHLNRILSNAQAEYNNYKKFWS